MTKPWTKVDANARSAYEQDGFLCPLEFLSTEAIAGYRESFDALEALEGRDETTINLKGRHFDQRFIWDLVTQATLLDWIEALVGPDVMLLSTHFFCKYPGGEDGHFVAWHQDVTYWGLEPADATTAWIAIDDSTVENGCMEVIPGSHCNGVLNHGNSDKPNNLLASNQAIAESQLDLSLAVPFTLRAGQMSIHHGMLAHASMPNQSQQRRCGLTARFVSPEVRQVRPSNNNEAPWWNPIVVRGVDTAGHFEVTPAPF